MQPFNFRLETLLKFRRIQEEQAQIALAQATAAYLAAQEVLTGLEAKLERHTDAFRLRRQERVTVATLKMFQNYHDRIKEDITNQSIQVESAARLRLECIKKMEEAVKARKLVEKLREKRLRQHNFEVLQEEQKHLDELGLQVFTRNN
jgi:flagellar FliJ protein